MADAQNPWFKDEPLPGTNPTNNTNIGQAPTPANTGMNQEQFNWAWGSVPQGATITSNGPDWLKPTTMHNLSEVLDPSKWQSWTPDQWRMWAGNAGGSAHNDVDSGLLANGMTQAQMNNYANTYGGTGNGYLGGRYDWTTGQMVYDSGISQPMIDKANTAPLFNGTMTGGVGIGYKPFSGERPDYTMGSGRPGQMPQNPRGGLTNMIPTSPLQNGRPGSTQAMQLAREAAMIQAMQEMAKPKPAVSRPSTTVAPSVTTTRPSSNYPVAFTPVTSSKRYID